MRIHCLENVDKALQFLKEQKVHLENMGSHDIVDGNHRLTLGLIWTIILRFQVQLLRIFSISQELCGLLRHRLKGACLTDSGHQCRDRRQQREEVG